MIDLNVWGFPIGGHCCRTLVEAAVGVIGITSLGFMGGGHCWGSLLEQVIHGRSRIGRPSWRSDFLGFILFGKSLMGHRLVESLFGVGGFIVWEALFGLIIHCWKIPGWGNH